MGLTFFNPLDLEFGGFIINFAYMEKITAYRAFNGKLFETEEKCLAYEMKMSQYPKSERETQTNPLFDVSYIVEYEKKTPNVTRQVTDQYVLVNGHKIRGFIYEDDIKAIMTFKDTMITQQELNNSFNLPLVVVKSILQNGKFDLKCAEYICGKFNEGKQESFMQMSKALNIWHLDDIRWHRGSMKPAGVKIELP